MVPCRLPGCWWSPSSPFHRWPSGRATFHRHHITERYGLFTVIVLGEPVLAATVAFESALTGGRNCLTAVAGIVVLFGMWWAYFDHESAHRLSSLRASLIWGCGHCLIFAAAAALGGG